MIPYLCKIKIQQNTLGKTVKTKYFEHNKASMGSFVFHLTHAPFKVSISEELSLKQQIFLNDLVVQFNAIFYL